METTLRTPFNETQIMLLKLFANAQTEQEELELKNLLVDFYNRKMVRAAERVIKEKNLTNEKVEALSREHLRTPYK
ncbi:MAG: hypothetical protein II109_05745 [Paludibacteraceae bacterium]|nr:hypothetical protein [Paludibacteraceae bacterium]